MKKYTNQPLFRGKKAISVTLAFVLMVIVPLTGALADDTSNTKATVTFTAGQLELGEGNDTNGINIDFGSHSVPVSSVQYPAEDVSNAHVLEVDDARNAGGDWKVSVKMSTFSDVSNSSASPFDGMITFTDGQLATTNTTNDTSGVTLGDGSNPIVVSSGTGSGTAVLTAGTGIERGVYTASWGNADVVLDIAQGEAAKVVAGSYAATLTWELKVGP